MPIQPHVWHIYFCPHCPEADKDKFVVVTYADEKTILGVFINTKSSSWLQKQSLQVCESSILASEHGVLIYDSFVDCHTVYEFNDFELTQDKGELSAQAKANIL